jgi:hypothetical protein
MAQAQSTVNFRELLKLNSTQVERAKSIPSCWLLGTIGSMEHEVTKGKGTNVFIFDMLDLEPHPGTEEGLLDGVDLSKLRSPYKKNLVANFWITPDSMVHLTNMLDSCVGDPERSIEERLPEVKGLRVMFKVNPVLDAEGKDTGQNEIDSRTMRIAAVAEEETQEAAE